MEEHDSFLSKDLKKEDFGTEIYITQPVNSCNEDDLTRYHFHLHILITEVLMCKWRCFVFGSFLVRYGTSYCL
jgi:hypothetical protein